jgi:hypothetical protein
MEMNFEKWHDGVGYDLAALSEMTPQELESVVVMLRGRSDWRDVEALAALESDESLAALKDSLSASDTRTRAHAARILHDRGQLPAIDEFIANELRAAADIPGASCVLDLAEKHNTQRVRDALLWCAKHHDSIGPHAAGMLLFFAGITDESFDWNHRPFFLRFLKDDPKDRAGAFVELCKKLKISPDSVP